MVRFMRWLESGAKKARSFLLFGAAARTSMLLGALPGLVVAAVARTNRPAAGELMVFSLGPSLPADASGTTPWNCKLPAATALAEFGSPDELPKLMFTTVARGLLKPARSRSAAASCKASKICVPVQTSEGQTL